MHPYMEYNCKLFCVVMQLTGMAIPTNGDEITEAVMADPFSNSSKSARTKHLLDLIQRNAELDARVKLLEEMDRENKNILKHERELRERADEQLRQKQDVCLLYILALASTDSLFFVSGFGSCY